MPVFWNGLPRVRDCGQVSSCTVIIVSNVRLTWPVSWAHVLKKLAVTPGRKVEKGSRDRGGRAENPSSIERVVTSSLWILIDIREFGYLGGNQSRHFEVEEIRIIEEKFSFCIVLISFISCFCIYFKETGDAENFSALRNIIFTI